MEAVRAPHRRIESSTDAALVLQVCSPFAAACSLEQPLVAFTPLAFTPLPLMVRSMLCHLPNLALIWGGSLLQAHVRRCAAAREVADLRTSIAAIAAARREAAGGAGLDTFEYERTIEQMN